MKTYVNEDGNIKLYNGDCLEAMKRINNESVDICITDIPYAIDFSEWDVLHNNKNSALGGFTEHQKKNTSFKRRGKPINGWSSDDKNIGNEYKKWLDNQFKEVFRLTKEGSPILIFSSRRFQHKVAQSLEDCGFIIKDILIWKKDGCHTKAQRINCVLNKRGMDSSDYDNYRLGNLKPMYEPIIYAFKPYKKTVTDCFLDNKVGGFNCYNGEVPSNIIEANRVLKGEHETQKPVELMEKLIRIFSIDKEHVILDFTMGSGSTGVACKNLNRKFIGIELDENYFDIAVKRLSE